MLKLVPPKKGRNPNWRIRGTYMRVYVDTSCGTDRRPVARAKLRQLEAAIERGEYPPAEPAPRADRPTFLSAAVSYLETGGEPRYVAALIKHFGEKALDDVDQAAIDAAAVALKPHASVATRNRSIHTPVSAILRHAGVATKLRRPKGAKGRIVSAWLKPDDAAAIITAARNIDPELALLLAFLLYTGVRLGEALVLRWDDVALDEGRAWLPTSKNGDPRMLVLRDDLRVELAAHKDGGKGPRVFRFRQGGHLKHRLTRAKLSALGIACPARRPKNWKPQPHRLSWVNFHSFRHTWATWMRIYGGADVQGLMATKNWRDPRSAARYAHVVPNAEWGRVEKLPPVTRAKSVR